MSRHRPHDHPDFDRPHDDGSPPTPSVADQAKQQISTADPNAVHLPPGIPGTAAEFAAFLHAGSFTDAQLAYLRAALPMYESAVNEMRDTFMPADAAKADEILGLWRAIVAANPAPKGDPFNLPR